MRVLVTGAGGGVGRALVPRLEGHEVAALTHADLPVEDPPAVRDAVTQARPDVVFHLAAMTSVDACELEPERAFAVNALGSRNVAVASREVGALLVAISTDYVFDGAKGAPYHEFDEPRPLSVYAATKLAGEREVRDHAPEHVVVRTAWVFGSGDDFVTRSLRRLAAGGEVGGIVDQVGSPTFVDHLADRLVDVAEAGARGTVHIAGPRPSTWHDVLQRARELGRLPGTVTEQKMGDLDRPAPRPADSSLTSLVAERYGIAPLPPVDLALPEVLARAGV